MGEMASQSPASRLFTQPSIQAQMKENIKVPRHWPLCGEFTGDRWFPAQMASNAEKFPFDDVIMYSLPMTEKYCLMIKFLESWMHK